MLEENPSNMKLIPGGGVKISLFNASVRVTQSVPWHSAFRHCVQEPGIG